MDTTHTEPDGGECFQDGLIQEGETPVADIQKYSGSTKEARAADGNQVLVFDLAKDPYELFNVYEQNKDDVEMMIDEIRSAGITFTGSLYTRGGSTNFGQKVVLCNLLMKIINYKFGI